MANGNGKNGIEPTALVVFGATGDLAQKKIYPSLFDLFSKGLLPKKFVVIAFGRRDFNDESYRSFVREAIESKKKGSDPSSLTSFLSTVRYIKGDFDDLSTYQKLSDGLADTDKQFNVCANKLFYLAVPPALYETILLKIHKSGLTIPCANGEGWTRVLIEKPFGKDIQTARRLDRLLGKLFKEVQIFRIDHYLAKETVRNILAFRFSNAIFEPIWNRKYIERIEIRAFEKDTVGSRGVLYDGLGALRDVGQNHLLSMLSLIAMEYPKNFSAQELQKARAQVVKNFASFGSSAIKKIVRGQYRGYTAESGVAADSQTETFFSLTTYLKGSRWKGVPIELSAGKGLSENRAEIRVHFKDVDSGARDVVTNRNILTFRIQPDEGISILFWVKKPGLKETGVHPQTLSFNYADTPETTMLPDAYEQVLYDCLRGDQTLFASTDEVEAAWKLVTPVLEKWGKNTVVQYDCGASFENIIKNS